MKEKFPTKEGKSKHHSRHEEWEGRDLALAIPLFPVFLWIFFFDDLF